jgi:hypothetical protein
VSTWSPSGDVLFTLGQDGVVQAETAAGVKAPVTLEEVSALRTVRYYWRPRSGNLLTTDELARHLTRWGIAAKSNELLPALASKGLVFDKSKPIDRETRRRSPVFFVHCPRSGSNMLRWLIDAHPRITCPPFSLVLHHLMESTNNDPTAAAAYRSLRSPRPWTQRILRRWFDQVLADYVQREGKVRAAFRHWVSYRSLHSIDEMFDSTPLYIFLVRHGLDVADAAAKVYPAAETWQVGPNGREVNYHDLYGGSYHLGYAHYWREMSERMLEFGSVHRDRVHLVRYEDLVEQPKQILSNMFEFIGEELPDELIQKAFAGPHPMLAAWEGHEVTRTSGIEAGRHAFYRAWDPRLLSSAGTIVNDTLEAWGYPRIPTDGVLGASSEKRQKCRLLDADAADASAKPADQRAPSDPPSTKKPRQFTIRDLGLKQAPLNPNPKPTTVGTA